LQKNHPAIIRFISCNLRCENFRSTKSDIILEDIFENNSTIKPLSLSRTAGSCVVCRLIYSLKEISTKLGRVCEILQIFLKKFQFPIGTLTLMLLHATLAREHSNAFSLSGTTQKTRKRQSQVINNNQTKDENEIYTNHSWHLFSFPSCCSPACCSHYDRKQGREGNAKEDERQVILDSKSRARRP
jgi:hypothetical protein